MMRRTIWGAALILSCSSNRETTRPPSPDSPPPVAAKAEEKKVTPAPAPAAPKGPQEMVQGVAVADPYRWLETATDPKVQEWMKTRDTDTRKKLSDLPGRAALAQRLHDLLYVETVSAPVKREGRFFYERKSADQEKAILYWRRS